MSNISFSRFRGSRRQYHSARRGRRRILNLHGRPDLNVASVRQGGSAHAKTAHPATQELLRQRIDGALLDVGYLSAVQPAVWQELQRVCGQCKDWRKCQRDISAEHDRVLDYCPNTPTIDNLILGRKVG